jgi:hypothetical protein
MPTTMFMLCSVMLTHKLWLQPMAANMLGPCTEVERPLTAPGFSETRPSYVLLQQCNPTPICCAAEQGKLVKRTSLEPAAQVLTCHAEHTAICNLLDRFVSSYCIKRWTSVILCRQTAVQPIKSLHQRSKRARIWQWLLKLPDGCAGQGTAGNQAHAKQRCSQALALNHLQQQAPASNNQHHWA